MSLPLHLRRARIGLPRRDKILCCHDDRISFVHFVFPPLITGPLLGPEPEHKNSFFFLGGPFNEQRSYFYFLASQPLHFLAFLHFSFIQSSSHPFIPHSSSSCTQPQPQSHSPPLSTFKRSSTAHNTFAFTTHIYSHARYPTNKVQHPPSPYPHIPISHPRPPRQRYLLKDLCPPYSVTLGHHLQLCRRHAHHKGPHRHPYARRSIVERVRQLCSQATC